jgi:carbon-monoxide dehydrogenase medium subunit
MKPPPFRLIFAKTLDEALAAKAAYGEDARFLAGGQSLVPALNFRLLAPAALIDINSLSELARARRSRDGYVRIGALTRYRDVERDLSAARDIPLIHEALSHIAHPQIRNRGTIGGNLAHSDPASELPAIVVALGGRLRAQSAKGERWIAAGDFFLGALTNALAADEMLVEIELPLAPPRSGSCFLEVARRRGDFAIIGVACMVRLDEDGRCSEARIGLCNAGAVPLLAAQAGQSLLGRHLEAADFDEAAALVTAAIDPGGSIHASKEFQRHLAGVLTKRALTTAHERVRHAH